MYKKIFKKLPLYLQNIIMTFYNIYILNKKFGYIPLVKNLKKLTKEAEQLRFSQSDKEILKNINNLILYAQNHTEYYKQNKDRYFLLKSLKDIKKLPFITKNILRENNDKFFSDESFKNVVVLHTSGTTGTPLTIRVRKKDLQLKYKLLLKAFSECNIDISKNYARFIGHDLFDDKKFFKRDILNNHIYFSIFHLTSQNIKNYVNIIKKYNITTLEAYPSVIYLFAKLINEQKLNLSVKNIITTAEKLHDYQKKFIEDTFKCKVFDYYGSNDQSVFIYTCKKGKLHVANTTGFLEVIDQNNLKDVEPGKEGKMIITSFTSYYMPLIRYDIGDYCVIDKEQYCECGNGGLIVKEILGRDEEIFQAKNGRYITRVSLFLKELPQEVIESQLIFSNKKNKITLLYVSNKNIENKNFSSFIKKLRSYVGNDYSLEIKRVDSIEIKKSGKRKAIKIEN